ncbi:MAG: RDD family protein [Mycobacteriales bacterium]
MSAAVGGESRRGRQPAVSPVPREGRPYQGRRAGVVSRLVANTVDFVVVVLVVAGGYAAVSAAMFLWSPSGFTFPQPSSALLLVSGAVVLFVYLTLSWATTGRSYGDHLLGLRVVNFRGERMHLSGAAARAALCVVFPIGVLYVLVSRANRSVQDVLLRTSVIYDWGPAAQGALHGDDEP